MSATASPNTVRISQPVLQSATSCRVSPSLQGSRNSSTSSQKDTRLYSSTTDLLKSIHQKQSSQERLNEAGVRRITTKYAAPDNMLAEDMNAHLNIASIEADAVGSRLGTNGVNGGSSAFSDTSSDISDSASSQQHSVKPTSASVAPPIVQTLTEQDIDQVDLFYRSHKTEVRVCKSLANVYVSAYKSKDRASVSVNIPDPSTQTKESKTKSKRSSKADPKPETPKIDSPDPSQFTKDDWEFAKTGIPVLVLDSGDHLRDRKLSIILAERGTGFTLWSDSVNHLTKYSTPHANFHTISLSTDSTRLVGLSFDEAKAAADFAEAVRALTENPEDDLLNLSNKKKKSKKKEKKPKYKAPKKVDISQPCCFVHMTKLERPDFLGIPHFNFPPPPSGKEVVISKDHMRRAMSESSAISDVSTTPSAEN